MTERGWNNFAWHGMAFSKPEAWDLAAVEGGQDRGYLRLDDDLFPRLEVRWERQDRDVALERVFKAHVEDLKKESRKRKAGFELLEKRDYKAKAASGIYFAWESDSRAANVIRQCDKCRRFVLVRVLGKAGDSVEQEADRIFASFRDHTGRSKTQWRVFDFGFTTPGEFKLYKHSFLSGHLRFDFTRGKDSFIFERVSVASVILKGKSLGEWLREFCSQEFKSVDLDEVVPGNAGPETGARAKGREKGRMGLFKKRFFDSLFWHCGKTNRIFGVAEMVRKEEASCLDSLVSGVKCH